ncbi:MAG: elongation factor P-like protein YeiP [Gammaproteobacteria bacterium]|nr:elongation factor P-like protein YeiP [Gammaproteobacteria bacterium]MBT7307112.1 elongation factor P-like protein YeiP [Gammaproteobacteria bacterium]
MPKASELKRGMVVEINQTPHAVKTVESKSPSSRGASTLYKIRFTNLQTGQKLDDSFKGDQLLKEADCQRRQVQYSYHDGEHYVFMDQEDYSQYEMRSEALTEEAGYLSEGLEGIIALLSEDKLLAIELPQSVSLTITETTPGIKGATATGRTKPATLSSGIEVQVPEYLEPGELIKVHTGSGKFISRAK